MTPSNVGEAAVGTSLVVEVTDDETDFSAASAAEFRVLRRGATATWAVTIESAGPGMISMRRIHEAGDFPAADRYEITPAASGGSTVTAVGDNLVSDSGGQAATAGASSSSAAGRAQSPGGALGVAGSTMTVAGRSLSQGDATAVGAATASAVGRVASEGNGIAAGTASVASVGRGLGWGLDGSTVYLSTTLVRTIRLRTTLAG